MWALIVKEFHEIARDKRTLAMLLGLPIIMLLVFGFAANFNIDSVDVIVGGPDAKSITKEINSYKDGDVKLNIIRTDSSLDKSDAEELLRDQKASVVIITKHGDGDAEHSLITTRMTAYVDGSSLFAAQSAQRAVLQLVTDNAQKQMDSAKASIEEAKTNFEDMKDTMTQLQTQLQQLQKSLAAGQIPQTLTLPDLSSMDLDSTSLPDLSTATVDTDDVVTMLFNPDLKTSWMMVPGLIGLILTFIGTVITSIGLVREREAGTLEQLAVMPVKPSAIIMGKIIPYFIIALLDMLVVTVLGLWIFGVPFVGNVFTFALGAFIFLFVVLGMGVLVSTISQNTGQAIQSAIMILLPQILLSGFIFPLKAMAVGVRWIGYILPLTYFMNISQGVLLRGAGMSSLWPSFVILAVEAVLVFGAATLRLRRTLTRGGAR